MSRDDQPSIPDKLRDRLEQEPADEREDLERIWHLLGEVDRSEEAIPAADATWAAVQDRLSDSEADAGRTDRPARRHARSDRSRSSWRTWAAVAAVVFVALVAGALFWRQPVEVETRAGEHLTASLPDGSTVELNSGTTLRYPRRFSTWPFVPAERRTVRLQGEAFFDVQKEGRPFVVETFNARVEVLGTQFNVRARSSNGDGATHITLASGQVRVRAARHPDNSVVLSEAGQSSQVAATEPVPTPPRTVEIDHALAWRRQGFAVSDWPLSMIFDEIERRYNTNITVRATNVLSDSMTLYYSRDANAKTIVHDIAIAKGLAYRVTSDGYEITPK